MVSVHHASLTPPTHTCSYHETRRRGSALGQPRAKRKKKRGLAYAIIISWVGFEGWVIHKILSPIHTHSSSLPPPKRPTHNL